MKINWIIWLLQHLFTKSYTIYEAEEYRRHVESGQQAELALGAEYQRLEPLIVEGCAKPRENRELAKGVLAKRNHLASINR